MNPNPALISNFFLPATAEQRDRSVLGLSLINLIILVVVVLILVVLLTIILARWCEF